MWSSWFECNEKYTSVGVMFFFEKENNFHNKFFAEKRYSASLLLLPGKEAQADATGEKC